MSKLMDKVNEYLADYTKSGEKGKTEPSFRLRDQDLKKLLQQIKVDMLEYGVASNRVMDIWDWGMDKWMDKELKRSKKAKMGRGTAMDDPKWNSIFP